MNRVCVFCGSSIGRNPRYVEAAERLGEELVARGLELVYGGGNTGLMNVLAEACLAGGGRVTGVIPEFLAEKQYAKRDISELHIVQSMHERKALMAEMADAFIGLPGGYGMLEEVCEMITWRQLQLHHNPCGLLNVEGYFNTFLGFLDHQTREGFVTAEQRGFPLVASDPAKLLDLLANA